MDFDSTGGMLGCPPPEDLAAFADGKLPRAQRARIEAHLADCEMCRELITDTVLLSTQSLPGERGAESRRRVMAAAGVGLALAASFMLVARLQPGLIPFGEGHQYQELVAAVGHNRTVEGRITGGFAYAPLRPATRAGREGREENFALLAASGELQQRAVTKPTAANRHAAGVAQLVVGDYDAAVKTLEAAVAVEPAKAAYHSDLAAAYIARGQAMDSRDDFSRAQAAAARAVALDPSVDEAYFNEALALESLGQPAEAEAAYRRALARDPESPWNAEINLRLQKVHQP